MYGPRVRALGVYVIVFQHIPYERDTVDLRVRGPPGLDRHPESVG